MLNIWLRRVLFILYVSFTILVSLLPGGGKELIHWDKVIHLLVYLVMAILALLSFKSTRARIGCICFIVLLSYGLEWAQSYIPGRDMSFLDGLSNTVGVLMGVVIYRCYHTLRWPVSRSRLE